MKYTLLLGSHMSIAGGVEQALYRGAALGCTAIQLFTSSNRQWNTKEFSPESVANFKQAKKETGITTIIAHASYLINLGSVSTEIVQKSAQALYYELLRCNQLGIQYLVLHPGSGTLPATECLKQIARELSQVLGEDTTNVMILLENTAGQGTSVGYNFEQLAYLRQSITRPERIGICFDTCHAFAAGYDFTTPQAYTALWDAFDKIIGLEHLKAMHINDSKKGLNSHVDRHEDIGKGCLGLEPFRLIMNDKRFFDIPKILETPKDSPDEDEMNLTVLKSLLCEEIR
ncbi:deoxyribonuclease IV [Candidatus Dependentiae bacterium]|nr:deoxyribonuclease IV [Candidatus Dependentiae bacterium]